MSSGNAVAPTSTSAQARVMLYQPSQRPRWREGDWTQTSFGRCRVTGRLGQKHADLVEAVLYCAERRRDVPDGGIELLVDPSCIRKTLADSRYSFTQIEKLVSVQPSHLPNSSIKGDGVRVFLSGRVRP